MTENESGRISFTCECGQTIRVSADKAGRKGRCKICGRKIVVPLPPRAPRAEEQASSDYVPPVAPKGYQEEYSEEDLVTYPEAAPVKRQTAPPVDVLREKPSLLHMLGDILRYPVSNKLAAQIFLTGAILFSPLVWKVMYVARIVPCIGPIFAFIAIISIRLMYFSYMLLIIQKSAEGSRKIPELPIFQTWEENLGDLLRVMGASVVAFSPFLVYATSTNLEFFARWLEASSRGEALGPEAMGSVSASLGTLVLLYATAAFYLPMVLMTLVVKKNFFRAINPLFIFRSIASIAREYLAAMLIIFLVLRGSLTLFTILKDVLDAGWFSAFAQNVGEPIIEFYVLVVTMHVIGLLYYRNGDRLNW